MENLCPDSEGTCVHRNGGYADRVRANARFVIPIPEALESEQAAPLLCGGITVYNPLRTHGVNPSSRVGVVGIGGLGHMAIQFARVFGAEVTAFSTSAAKEEEARALGAHNFVNSRESKAMKEVAGTHGFYSEHRQRRPGLGHLRAGAAAHRNAVLCGRSSVAGLRACLSADLRAAHRSAATRRAALTGCARCWTWPRGTASKPHRAASPWPRPTRPSKR